VPSQREKSDHRVGGRVAQIDSYDADAFRHPADNELGQKPRKPEKKMRIHRPTVLILASDPAFSREVTANWPQDSALHSNGPEFIVLDEGFSRDLEGNNYDLAIVDASSSNYSSSNYSSSNDGDDKKKDGEKKNKSSAEPKRPIKAATTTTIKELRQKLVAAGKPAILIHPDATADFHNILGPVLELRRERGVWPILAGLIGREILRRCQAESRAQEAEAMGSTAHAEATLGRYMVEMRTNVNNALTTILGNAELLALEPGLPATVQAQADAIRNMALRLHEVFQRFSSIEKELSVAARESGKSIAHAAGK
jgi:hypothetical protein